MRSWLHPGYKTGYKTFQVTTFILNVNILTDERLMTFIGYNTVTTGYKTFFP